MPVNKRSKTSISNSAVDNVIPLLIILVSIICVFAISRWITYFILISGHLPPSLFAKIGNFRLHHFVYGNILITITSFMAIGLGINRHRNLFALFYGIGLGLVLDEFMLWIGNIQELGRNTMWIPYSSTIVSLVVLFVASVIMFNFYKTKLNDKKKKK